MPTLRILSRAVVKRTVTMKDAIALMRDAFAALSSGHTHVPVRMNVAIPEHQARALFMPVYSPAHGQVAQKIVAVHPNNTLRGLPFIHALVILIDAASGTPLAVMDGEFITALRTGAGAGLATELLALPDASTAAIFGAGVQARTQLEALLSVRPIERVLIYGRSKENAARFAAEASAKYGIDVSVARNLTQLSDADVICTATTSLTPVFDDSYLKPGCHINGVGSFRPNMTEIPADTVCRAALFVDQRAAALEEAGDLIAPIRAGRIDEDHIRAELGEVAMGKAQGRKSREEVTFFKSVGSAAQDLAVASRAYALADQRGLGVEVEI